MNPAKGIAFKLISAGLFAVMSALIRHLGARYPIGQGVFYRSVFAIIPVVLVYAWRGELAAVLPSRHMRSRTASTMRNEHSGKYTRKPPLCPSCAQIMRVARITSRFGGI
jgi:hypothetical protein